MWREDLLVKFLENIKVAGTKLPAIGEEIAARLHGNRVLRAVPLDVTALQSTLQTLQNQVELAADDAAPIRVWLEQLRLLAEESAGMDMVDSETAHVLAELNPDFIPRLVETIFLISLARSQKDFRLIFLRLEEQEREFEQIIDQMRQGFILSRSLTFKQRFAHTLIICKRLIYRLRSLTDVQSRFPAFVS